MVYPAQYPEYGVRAGDTVGQAQVFFEPPEAGDTEKGDIFGIFHPADHGDDAEQENIDQQMFFPAGYPGVRDN
jgi:hypothetical protein